MSVRVAIKLLSISENPCFNTTSVSVRGTFKTLLSLTFLCFNTTSVSVRVNYEKSIDDNGWFQYNFCVGSRLLLLLMFQSNQGFNTTSVSVRVSSTPVFEMSAMFQYNFCVGSRHTNYFKIYGYKVSIQLLCRFEVIFNGKELNPY